MSEVRTNAGELAAVLRGAADSAERRAAELVRHHTLLLETQVKANASGRPGPRVQTGDYRRSINSRFYTEGGALRGSVGTNAPQARRLEYGFVGEDRLGRRYNQAPLPHFAPALDAVRPAFLAALAALGADL